MHQAIELLSRHWKAIVQIGVFFGLLYGALRFLKGTRGEGILKGLAFIVLVAFAILVVIARYSGLEQLNFLLTAFLQTSVFALIIIFQPELRRGLIRLGQTPFLQLIMRREEDVIVQLVDAVARMSRNKVGALIAIEQDTGLKNYIEGGTKIDAVVSQQLIESIFFPGSPLHDGAIIIKDDNIAAAGCLFPLTENPLPSKNLGTRHRAGIGISEEADAIVVIVSEETGSISLAYNGQLTRDLDRESLHQLILDLRVAAQDRTAA